ncbi:MogA/MoaB family molybdenum cofactor biosynthesis protein [Leucobacter viscericola]|uniref:MogA/MoaB family molybdenum cofactor biosynthesis protein n=1 Tax=Leucobacter viscericola TaxID=2714935 RepID=A0A6G7XDP3_9MICO|nr:MogA/MoaB family molybdenum cofactor biosynthesis protein [Leucobacter viscericola]QIK62517.1 MogA/MoaB family molybdenum cofactor biosynthesis protein [Leucobacter viscericola]
MTRRAVVIVASTRAAAEQAEDRTGPVIRDWLEARGFETNSPVIVADGSPVGDAARTVLKTQPTVIITTGGTGISPSDATPEQIAPLLDVQLPGIIEEIRRRGAAVVATAIVTRGVAGFSGDTFLVTLPGSPGGVRDGLAVLDSVLEHLLGQRMGSASGNH